MTMMTSSALFARSLRRTCLAIACAACTSLAAQTVLPAYPTNQVERKDWLVDKIETKTGVCQTAEGHIVLSNGLTRRVFTQSPNVATISLDELTTNTSLLRLPGKTCQRPRLPQSRRHRGAHLHGDHRQGTQHHPLSERTEDDTACQGQQYQHVGIQQIGIPKEMND